MSALHKFVFEALPVRGALVQLGQAWRELLMRRAAKPEAPQWPLPVSQLVGELAAAGVLLHASIKFNGTLVLQLAGDGPLKLALAEVQADFALRATATFSGAIDAQASLTALANQHGQGRIAVTLEPQDKRPGQQSYQGIAPLNGPDGGALPTLSAALEHYMWQSEQLETCLVLAASPEGAAGLMLQRLPSPNNTQDTASEPEDFNRLSLLARSLTANELLSLDAQTLLHRLFWQESLRLFSPLTPRFACRCSRARVAAMLRGLGQAEAQSIIAERGLIEVACEFCGLPYHFDAVDAERLFTAAGDQPPASSAVQ